ncbi:MAG TPA: hypothetical protein VIW67_10865 [Terriglobales bacterium]
MNKFAISSAICLFLVIGCATTRHDTEPFSNSRRHRAEPVPRTASPAPSISYNTNKVSRGDAISAVASVFLAHGYKSASSRQSGVQIGQGGTVIPFSEGPIRYIDTELQPPTEASSKEWSYRAVVNDDNVEMLVFAKCTPYNLLGTTIDRQPTTWKPPDLNTIMQEIQRKLQSDDEK